MKTPFPPSVMAHMGVAPEGREDVGVPALGEGDGAGALVDVPALKLLPLGADEGGGGKV